MKFNRREKITFECACIIEDIQINSSEKTKRKYAKIISVEGTCFLCFSEKVFQRLCETLSSDNDAVVTITGEVTQKRGGTYLAARKFVFKNTGGEKVSLDEDEDKEGLL